MRKLRILLGATILLLGAGSAVLADDDAGTFLDGTASVGVHYGDFTDNPQKAGEFISIEDLGETNVHLLLDLLGGDDASLFDIQAYYYNTRTKGFDFGLHTSSLVSANFSYQSFVHNLGHDTLVNLQAKEANPDGAGGYTPGGKQIYHTDNDPLGRYYYQYQDFTGDVSIDLPFLADGQVYGAYHDQRRTGYKQTMTTSTTARSAMSKATANGSTRRRAPGGRDSTVRSDSSRSTTNSSAGNTSTSPIPPNTAGKTPAIRSTAALKTSSPAG